MRRLALVVLAISIAVPSTAAASQRIVGGSAVPDGEFPFVANISVADAASCTGTLIAPKWVMTAGHCGTPGGLVGVANPAPFPPSAFAVTLGTVRTDGKGGEEHAVSSVHIAPGYFATNGQGSDVTLLELTEASAITPMRIAATDERSSWEAGDAVTAAGFGLTEAGGEQPDVMQRVDVPIVADATCAKAYSDPTPIFGDAFNKATEVCAGLPEGGKDSCQGDSGGPLMSHVGSGLRLIGATSRGEGCAEPGFPGIYARVAEGSLRDFVKGFAPGALEPEGTPDGGGETVGTPGTPTTPSPSTCKARRIAVRGKLRKVRIRINGRTVLNRRGAVRPFRFKIKGQLSPAKQTRIRVFTRSADGTRRVTLRIYSGCRRTDTRKRTLG